MITTLNRDQLAQKFISYLDATDEQRTQQVEEGHAKEYKEHGHIRVARKHPYMWGTVEHRHNGGTGGYDRVLLDDGIDPDMVRGYLAS